MGAMLNNALSWAARGFRVFPCIVHGKVPAVDQFQYRASCDPDDIRTMWRSRDGIFDGVEREYNVGVLTGGDLVVADLDEKNGRHGVASFKAHIGEPNTLTVRTPTGGYHLYFNGPNSKQRVDMLDGVDIRSHHGYVLAPGSRVVDTTKNVDGVYEVVNDAPVTRVPIQLEVMLDPPGSRVRQDGDVQRDTVSAISNASVWLQTQAEPAIEGMGGNNQTYRVASRLVRDYALSEEIAWQLLAEHYNPRCMPPWRWDELASIVSHAAEYATGDLGALRADIIFNGVSIPEVPEPEPLPTPSEIGLALGNLIRREEITDRDWIASNFLLRREVTSVAAAGSVGKSSLTLAAMAHYALGLDFGPYKLAAPGVPLRSFIYNAEDKIEEQARRFAAVCSHFNLNYEQAKQNIAFLTPELFQIKLAARGAAGVEFNEQQIEFLVDFFRSNRIDIVSLDPLLDISDLDISNPTDATALMGLLNRVSAEAEVAMILWHHIAKGRLARGDADSSLGSVSIVNKSRISLTMSNANEDDITTHGFAEHERNLYLRVDDAKANYFLKGNDASLWLKRHGIRVGMKDIIGVVAPEDMSGRGEFARAAITEHVRDAMLSRNTSLITVAEAAKYLMGVNDAYRTEATAKTHILRALDNGMSIGGDRLQISTEQVNGRRTNVVKLL